MENLKTEFCAYLFPAVSSDVQGRMGKLELSEESVYSTRLGENGVVVELSVLKEKEEETKNLLKETFGTAIYSFDTEDLAEVVVKKLKEKGKKLSVAESCTGGLLSKRITDIPGASNVFELGMTVYSNGAKAGMLNVSEKTLDSFGAVSRETAEELAYNVLKTADADIGVSITGLAGPDGDGEKPVGLVYIGIATKNGYTAEKLQLGENKSRDSIRKETVLFALCMINQALDETQQFSQTIVPFSKGNPLPTGKMILGKVKSVAAAAARYLFPLKADSIKEKVRKIVFLLAISVFIGSGIYIGHYFLSRLSYDRQIEELKSLTLTEPTAEEIANLPPGYIKKFASLYAINPDIVGWIQLGDTIDLPVVKFSDNDYYLKKDFYKKDNYHGIPFMDYRCSARLTTTNTIIYGHNVKPDRMFASLLEYRRLAYYKQNPNFTYDSVYGESKWKVLYVMITDSDESRGGYFDYHNFINASDDAEFYEFIDECKRRTIINTTVDVNPTDTLLTLSTCGFDFAGERMVIVARRVRSGESETVDVAHAYGNPNVLMPDIWYSIWGGTKPSFGESSDSSSDESSFESTESLPDNKPEYDPSVSIGGSEGESSSESAGSEGGESSSTVESEGTSSGEAESPGSSSGEGSSTPTEGESPIESGSSEETSE